MSGWLETVLTERAPVTTEPAKVERRFARIGVSPEHVLKMITVGTTIAPAECIHGAPAGSKIKSVLVAGADANHTIWIVIEHPSFDDLGADTDVPIIEGILEAAR